MPPGLAGCRRLKVARSSSKRPSPFPLQLPYPDLEPMLRALLIRHPHIDKILDGQKTWEIRGSRTNIQGRIALVASGSGMVIGVCDLAECIGPLTANSFRKNAAKAGIRPSEATLGRYPQTYAWVLEKPKRLKNPVPYKHPSGAIIWVTLDRSVERKILDQVQILTPHSKTASPKERGLFAIGEIVSIKNDDPAWEDETVIGIVVKIDGHRMKVVFAIETGVTKISWLLRHDEKVPNRWIDKSYAAIVEVEEASMSQREAFQRWVPADRQAQLFESERHLRSPLVDSLSQR